MNSQIASRNYASGVERIGYRTGTDPGYDFFITNFAGVRSTMGKLSTHVLDSANGRPGAGVRIDLYAIGACGRTLLRSDVSNDDGRCAAPLLEGTALLAGQYELVFHAGDYYAARGVALPAPRFLDRIVIAFGIADPAQNYHVPLVMTPWSYSTYRGS